MYEIPLNCHWIAARNTPPDRVVIMLSATDRTLPTIQRTVDKMQDEAEDQFLERVLNSAKELMQPYGYKHYLALVCKYGAEAADRANDQVANLERLLWYAAINDRSYKVRSQALAVLSRLYRATPNQNS